MKKFMLVVISLLLMTSPCLHAYGAVSFSDVRENDWFHDTVTELSGMGVINGYPSGKFLPNGTINADEFIKMTIAALGYTDIGSDPSYWAKPYIDKASGLGLICEGEFSRYTRPICRNEMARIVTRALDEDYPGNLRDYSSLVTDYAVICPEYRDYVLKAYCKGILTGYTDASFKGEQTATRAEAAAIIHRLIDPGERKVPDLPGPPGLPEFPGQPGDRPFEIGRRYIGDITHEEFVKLCTSKNTTPQNFEIVGEGKVTFNGYEVKKTINPHINEQIYYLMRALVNSEQYTYVLYADYKGIYDNRIIFKFGKSKVAIDADAPYYWITLEEQTYFSARKDWNYNNFSDKCFMTLNLQNLCDTPEEKPAREDLKERLRCAMIAVFGEHTGKKVYEYVFDALLYARNDIKFDYCVGNPYCEVRTIDNVQVDFAYDSEVWFSFSYIIG